MLIENTASIWLQTCLKTSTCVVRRGLVRTWRDLPAILKQALQAHDPQLCPSRQPGKCPSRNTVDSLNHWAMETWAVQASKTLWWAVILERLLRTESSNPRLEEETSVGSRLVWYWYLIYPPTWPNHKRSNGGEQKEQKNPNRVFSYWTQGFLGGESTVAFVGSWLRERQQGDSYQQIMNRSCRRLGQFSFRKAGIVPVQREYLAIFHGSFRGRCGQASSPYLHGQTWTLSLQSHCHMHG